MSGIFAVKSSGPLFSRAFGVEFISRSVHRASKLPRAARPDGRFSRLLITGRSGPLPRLRDEGSIALSTARAEQFAENRSILARKRPYAIEGRGGGSNLISQPHLGRTAIQFAKSDFRSFETERRSATRAPQRSAFALRDATRRAALFPILLS